MFTVTTYGQLIAVTAHVMGFQPRNSIVLIGQGGSPSAARIDFPTSDQIPTIIEQTAPIYSRENASVILIAYLDDPAEFEGAAQIVNKLGDQLSKTVPVLDRLLTATDTWRDATDSTTGGTITEEDRSIIAATAAYKGMAQPVADREALADQFDRTETFDTLPEVDPIESLEAVITLRSTGNLALTATETAQLLAIASNTLVGSGYRGTLNKEDAETDFDFWTQAATRIPEDLDRTPVLHMCALLAWLKGNTALATVALEVAQTENPASSPVAEYVKKQINRGTDPKDWDR